MIQNKALRIATGCHQKAAACDLRAETGVLPLRAHLELCSQQFYARPSTPTHQSHNCHPIPALSGLPSRPHTTALSQVCESEVTTPKPPPSSGACWKRAPIPWPDDSSMPDDRGDHPVPGTQQSAYGHPLQLTRPIGGGLTSN